MVRFKCGCIGFPMDKTRFICLDPCDDDVAKLGGETIFLSFRMIEPGRQDSYELLSDQDLARWQSQINGLLEDGRRYRKLQQAYREFTNC